MKNVRKGDYLFHKREGIMFVDDIVDQNIGDEIKKYLVLKLPYSFDSITMKLPLDSLSLFREPRSVKEMDKIIKSFKNYEDMWIVDNKKRKEVFNEIIDSEDTYKIHCVANTIINKRKELSSLKKPLPLQDSRILDLCLKLIKEEIAYVYDLKYEEVDNFIQNKLAL